MVLPLPSTTGSPGCHSFTGRITIRRLFNFREYANGAINPRWPSSGISAGGYEPFLVLTHFGICEYNITKYYTH